MLPRCLPALVFWCACLLAGCTVQFTPGDAKPAVFTPYPSGAASSTSSDGEGMRGGPGTPP